MSAERLANEIRQRLGRPPEPDGEPLVSIVVLNRDGVQHLRHLVAGLAERTDYPSLELIVVDNDSSDDSIPFLRRVAAPFPISIVANPHNESFSDACNQGAEIAAGDILLFLNNDVEPFEHGWLRELLACLRRPGTGIAGSTLIHPSEDSKWGFRVQHRAIQIVDRDGMLGPDRRSYGAEPLAEGFGEDVESPVAAGACVLIERDLFRRVGGFSHGYLYGGEDIDLGLKVWAAGRSVVCSGRSLLIHRLGSTRTREDEPQGLGARRGNRRLVWERWGPRMRREYELDRLAGGGSWAAPSEDPSRPPSRAEALALGFCLKSSEPAADDGDPLEALRAALRERGHRCAVLRGEELEDLAGFNYDVAVHLGGPARYVTKPGQLNVLWRLEETGAPGPLEGGRYDLVLAGEGPDELIEAVLARAEELRLPTRIREKGGDATQV